MVSPLVTIPVGFCQCGCGQSVGLVTHTRTKDGVRKGEPVRFARGHNRVEPDRVALFWSLVDKNGPVHPALGTPCWLWTGQSSTSFGYGLIRWRFGVGRGKRPLLRAHRVAWELTNGPIPPGMKGCHRCDNPKCVNPAHLFLGTDKDNHDDMWAKGRGFAPRGENHPKAVLRSADVMKIRQRLSEGESATSIGRSFGVSGTTICGIKYGRSWRCV